MDGKRLFLHSSTAVFVLLFISACSPAMESLQRFRLSDFLASAQTASTDTAVAVDTPTPIVTDVPSAASEEAQTGDQTYTEGNDEVATHEPSVSFVSPTDGEIVTSPFDVEMSAAGLAVEPAGEVHEGAGHMHILVDEDFVAPGDVILTTDKMIHFGQGQLTTTLDLEPGVHTLRLQFANGAHIALDGDQYRDEITVTVAGPDDSASAEQEPSVFFVSPTDGEVVISPFDVEMGAAGLAVEPAGEIHEGAGHMHILVDEDFVTPGDVILTTDKMIHFGQGQLTTTLDLEPGVHTLRLQFANGAHIALDGDQYRDEITVTVAEPDDSASAEQEPSVFFVSPTDGEIVTSPFDVEMGAAGLAVEPAGEVHEGAGHMHILIDESFVLPGEVILSTDKMIHFGQGQLTTTLDLEPGVHTLRLQFANGAHIALDGDQYRDEITVTVAEPDDSASAEQQPSVFFLSPTDGEVVTSPFDVEMGAAGLAVEPAGEIHEGAGHMHILVDDDFVDAGQVILTTDTMIHFGQGQLTTTLDLDPGVHTLRLQFANGAHIALDGDEYRDEITVTVAAPQEPSVFFVSPADGEVVTSPLDVEMGATGLTVEPAGDIHEGAGHMHILVDEDFVPPGEVILTTDAMIHFGQGQLTTTLDLEPGVHTLRLQFANGAHIALDGDQYRDEITVTVAGPDDSASAEQEPSVFFVSPTDGEVVISPFDVEMGAAGLAVEPAGEIHEGAGHMHILVDEDFVTPGDVILTTDKMIHFGQGQLTTTLDLEPGVHTLRLQFA
ncbi:MAG: DUF4399 domain-containing protein, partial [Caldilineaceae bacterium]